MTAYISVKKANCKNCYKCLKYCAVKSISYINDRVEVLADQCVLCGKCINVCPQKAKTVVNDPARILDWLADPEVKVAASLAPAWAGVFGEVDASRMADALRRLGFDTVEETAAGAAEVTARYRELLDEGNMPSLLTTCCPTVNLLIERYYPDLIPLMAPVVSPALAHGRMLKKRLGEKTRVVFIGPCLSKIKEINDHPESADGVLTFRQLDALFEERSLLKEEAQLGESSQPAGGTAESGGKGIDGESSFSRIYPVPEGIVRDIRRQSTVAGAMGRADACMSDRYNGYDFISVCGLENVMAFLQEMRDGHCGRVFAELNSCDGGCVGGPLIPDARRAPFRSRLRVERYAAQAPAFVSEKPELSLSFQAEPVREDMPDEKTIRRILSEIGKPTPDRELNCGSCGYPTCRDKAIAVYRGKAELYMCLPYINDISQSLSSVTLTATPNYIIAVDRDLRIIEFNLAAQKRFGVSRQQAVGSELYEYLDPSDFEHVFLTGKDIHEKKVKIESLGVIVEQSLIYVLEQNIVIGFLKDITNDEKERTEKHRARLEAAEMAQKVIEKQMIAAHEIASLLGETTAETKVTLNNLKKQIMSEEEDLDPRH